MSNAAKKEETTIPGTDGAFCSISFEDFVVDPNTPIDIYIKISKERFIKVAHRNSELDLERLESYRNKGVTHLYVKKDDYNKIVNYNIKVGKALKLTETISPEKKKRFLNNTGLTIVQNCFITGIDEVALNQAKDFLTDHIESLTDDQESFKLLLSLSEHTDKLYAHSLAVAIYSTMIARQMGWTWRKSLEQLSLGALLHDIGKREYPKELLDKPKSELSHEEKLKLESHVNKGRAIVEKIPHLPAEVHAIVTQHHENEVGSGFPHKLKSNKIHPMAKIVAVANEFCNFMMGRASSEDLTAKKVLYLISTYKQDQLDKEAFEALSSLVKG